MSKCATCRHLHDRIGDQTCYYGECDKIMTALETTVDCGAYCQGGSTNKTVAIDSPETFGCELHQRDETGEGDG